MEKTLAEINKKPLRVMFLVRSLDYGGAESQLLLLTKNLPTKEVESRVVPFYDRGKLFSRFEEAGIMVLPIHKKSRWDVIPFVLRLIKMVRETQPDVIYSILAVPNILGAFLKIFFRKCSLVMGVRGSFRDLAQYDWLYRLSFWLEQKMVLFADSVIVNSFAGQNLYIQKGFPQEKMIVVHNGIDTKNFFKEEHSGKNLRSQWNISDQAVVVGMVGRLDPVKDHPTFLAAAALVKKKYPQTCFIIVGDGPTDYLGRLKEQAAALGLAELIHWEKARQDVRSVYNALDILCLSSKGEGFPNVVAEAMACETPCVATRVGDVPIILGETGVIVQPENSSDLAEGLIQMISFSAHQRAALGKKAAQRIRTNFSVENLVLETIRALKEASEKQ